MKADPLTVKELDKLANGGCECGQKHGPMFLHGACHPQAPTWVSYDPETETLKVECAICRQEVATILVRK